MSVIVNTRTGQTGDYSTWVSTFTQVWRDGRSRLPEFMSLLSPEIKLTAPGLRSTQGWIAGESAFKRTFDVLPDLTAQVERWSATGDVLFIEMTFSATIGGKRVKWRNVDRFVFRDGMAVERVAFFNPGPVRAAFLRSPGRLAATVASDPQRALNFDGNHDAQRTGGVSRRRNCVRGLRCARSVPEQAAVCTDRT